MGRANRTEGSIIRADIIEKKLWLNHIEEQGNEIEDQTNIRRVIEC